MGDETNSTKIRGDEQLVQPELNIKDDTAKRLMDGMDILFDLITSELKPDVDSVRGRDHELTVYLVDSTKEKVMEVSMRDSRGDTGKKSAVVVTFRPRIYWSTTSSQYDRIEGLEQAAIQVAIDSGRVRAMCNTEKTGTKSFHSAELTLTLADPDTIGVIPTQGTAGESGRSQDVLRAMERVADFADIVTSNEWTLLRPE
jgi:hypothetical protein